MIPTEHNNTFRHFLAVLTVGALLFPVSALGFFSSTQTSPQQNFSAGTLSFEHITPHPASGTVTPDTPATSSVTIETTVESIPAIYKLAVTETDGSASWCSELDITATSPSGTAASDTVGNFVSGEQAEFGEWELNFSTESTSVAQAGAVCDVTFTADTWHEQMSQGTGFVDDVSFTMSLTFANESDDEVKDEDDEDKDEEEENGPSDPGLGDVVINEIMWMGSSASYTDQWIELRNTTDEDIDVGQWIVENGEEANQNLMLPANSVIPANDLFVLYRRNPQSPNSAVDNGLPNNQIRQSGSLNLANDYDNNGALVLRTPDGTLIDQTPEPTSASWPHGKSDPGEKRWSMQRGANPSDGTDPDHWYTCDPDVLDADGTLTQMQGYWKSGTDINCGTPGQENLSSNDPTKDSYQPATNDDSKPVEDETEDEPKNRDEKDGTEDNETADTSEESQDKDTDEDSKDDDPNTSDSAEQDEEKRKEEDSDKGGDDDGDATGSDEKVREEDAVRDDEQVEDSADDADAANDGGDGADDEDEDEDGDDDVDVDTENDEDEDSSSDDTEVTMDDEGTGDDDITLDESDSNNE